VKLRRCLVVLPLLLFCLNALAQKGVHDVVVTNTTANPVPTVATGTTAVTGTVAISGTPNVNVANLPNLSTDTTTFSTVDVAARNIVRLRALLVPDRGLAFATLLDSTQAYVVPEGKRLVINSATVLLSGPIGIKPFPFLETGNFRVFLEPHKIPPSQLADYYVAGVPAPIYVDQGQSISVNFFASFGSPAAEAEGYLQGYLVDCGTGCTQQ
jgi:hypothetical protein